MLRRGSSRILIRCIDLKRFSLSAGQTNLLSGKHPIKLMPCHGANRMKNPKLLMDKDDKQHSDKVMKEQGLKPKKRRLA